jgi:hypothetical protein
LCESLVQLARKAGLASDRIMEPLEPSPIHEPDASRSAQLDGLDADGGLLYAERHRENGVRLSRCRPILTETG